MRILVTGGSSFAARYIVPALEGAGHCLAVSYRRPPITQQESAKKALSRDIVWDLADQSWPSRLTLQVDAIVHLAGNSSISGASKDSLYRDNALAAQHVMEFARSRGVLTVVALSTVSVHGLVEGGVLTDSTPCRPTDPYGQSKLAAEQILREWTTGGATYALRIPALVGAGAHRHWLARSFEAAIVKEDVVVANPMQLFNNVVHWLDLVRHICQLLDSPRTGFYAYPLASSVPIPMDKVARLVVEHSLSRSSVRIDERPFPGFTIDDSFARDEFDYRSFTTTDAITRYIREACADEGRAYS